MYANPPAHVFALTDATSIVKTYNLTSINGPRVGAAALDRETLERFQEPMPGSDMIQGYGLTEAGIVSCEHDRAGELVVQIPSIVPGYYGDETATEQMLTHNGSLRTGDLVEFRKSAKGYSHVFVIDRIKDPIKVNSMQVAPAEIGVVLRSSRLVADVSIVPLPHDRAGEVPRAYIAKSTTAMSIGDHEIQDELHEAVNAKFPPYKRLAGGIALLPVLPKTASGKVRRDLVKRMARDHYKSNRKASERTSELEALRCGVSPLIQTGTTTYSG